MHESRLARSGRGGPDGRLGTVSDGAVGGARDVHVKRNAPAEGGQGTLRRAYFLTRAWIRCATVSRRRWLRVITRTVSSPAIVPMISAHPV
jgi:hypothetical protein